MPIIYYDGNCVYCYNYAIWLIQNGLSRRYQFAKLQGSTAQNMFENYQKQNNTIVLFCKKETNLSINQMQ